MSTPIRNGGTKVIRGFVELVFIKNKQTVSEHALIFIIVGTPGFEPGLNPPKGLVLPLHYVPPLFKLSDFCFIINSDKIKINQRKVPVVQRIERLPSKE